MIFEKQVLAAYRAMAYTRCDDTGVAYYFSAKDFPTLFAEEYDFTSSRGDLLRGFLYSYPEKNPSRLVVFDHGFGGGHLSYMKEIELLARRGYLVFAYDHTGCMRSGGESPNGMAQSLSDLNDALLKGLRALTFRWWVIAGADFQLRTSRRFTSKYRMLWCSPASFRSSF